MKGSAALMPNNNHNLVNATEDAYQQPHNQCEDLLPGLGFEEGEIEILSDELLISQNDLVARYLQIAGDEPYYLNWQTGEEACVAEDMLGEYTKHDIAKDVFNSFSQQADEQLVQQRGGRKKKSRHSTKKRVNKKKRSTRKRRYRRSRK